MPDSTPAVVSTPGRAVNGSVLVIVTQLVGKLLDKYLPGLGLGDDVTSVLAIAVVTGLGSGMAIVGAWARAVIPLLDGEQDHKVAAALGKLPLMFLARIG